jgi:hypothetical protein
MTDQVRVCFALEQDEVGWPPVTAERMWATPTSKDNAVVIDNIPFFVRGVACYDVVAVAPDAEGILWGHEQIRWSGNCTIRVIPYRQGPLQGNPQAVLDTFAPYGIEGEGVEQYGLAALNIPAKADLKTVKHLLKKGEKNNHWAYEEGCVGPAWQKA